MQVSSRLFEQGSLEGFTQPIAKPGPISRDQQCQWQNAHLSLVPTQGLNSRISQRERNPCLCSGCRNNPSESHEAETDTTVQHHTFHQSHNTEGTNPEKSQACPGLQKERVSGLPSLTRKGTNYVTCNSPLVYSCPPCYSNLTQNKLFWNLEKSYLCLSFYQTQGMKVQLVGQLLQTAGIKKP